jgi:hypothetical protein
MDNNEAEHKINRLEDFVKPFCKGQIYDASFALYSKDADGNFYEEVMVIVKVKPERELSFEVTDRTQVQRREKLANTIRQGIRNLKGVHPISPTNAQAVTAPNPFGDTGRITDPDRFFGRQRLMREVQQLLVNGCSVSLVGPSEIGKSSFLYYLYLTRDRWLPSVPVEYFDLQRVLNEVDFCETILSRLGQQSRGLRDLRRALESQHVVLLFDEVERLAKYFHPVGRLRLFTTSLERSRWGRSLPPRLALFCCTV